MNAYQRKQKAVFINAVNEAKEDYPTEPAEFIYEIAHEVTYEWSYENPESEYSPT